MEFQELFGMITTKIQVEHLAICLLKLFAIKITPTQQIILLWESWLMNLCSGEDLITEETENKFAKIF